MAQLKPQVEMLLDDHGCESKESICEQLASLFNSAPKAKNASPGSELRCDESKSPSQVSESKSHNLLGGLPASATVFHLFEDKINTPQLNLDLDNLTNAELNKTYKKEYDSWRNRKSAAKKNGIPFYPKWGESFRVFLRDVGTIPVDGYTLDKIIPELGYVPKNVRWASKETQTRNRPNIVWLTIKGERLPLAAWASRTGQPESTLRYRKDKGWPDENIVSGELPEKPKVTLENNWPWPPKHAKQLERVFIQDTRGRADRLHFLLHKAAKALKAICQEAEHYMFPDWYVPDEREAKELQELARQYELWTSCWFHGKHIFESKGGGRLSIQDNFLNGYR